MQNSVSICEEDTTIFEMSWPRIFALRDRLARKYYYVFHESVPLPEFLSAGNLAIARSLRMYDPRTNAGSFRTYLGHALVHAYCTAWEEEHKGHLAYRTRDGKQTVTRKPFRAIPVERAVLPDYPSYDRRHDALRLLGYLQASTTPREQEMLEAHLQEMPFKAIGAMYQRAEATAREHVYQTLARLQAWAYKGHPTRPPALQGKKKILTPKDRATAARLWREGMSKSAIARWLGCDRQLITRILQKGPAGP